MQIKKSKRLQPMISDVKDFMTEERIERMKDTFDEFDDDNDGEIEIQSLERALRAYGCNPTASDMTAVMEECNRMHTVNFNTFAYFAYHMERFNNTEKQLVKAFAVYDKDGTGKIKCDVAQSVLSSLNRPLQPQHMKRIFSGLEVDNGFIEYRALVTKLMNS